MHSSNLVPFGSIAEASYWGSGSKVISDPEGGYWAIGGRNTPTGPELWSIGALAVPEEGKSARRQQGWPTCARGRYVWAVPVGGGPATVCDLRKPAWVYVDSHAPFSEDVTVKGVYSSFEEAPSYTHAQLIPLWYQAGARPPKVGERLPTYQDGSTGYAMAPRTHE